MNAEKSFFLNHPQYRKIAQRCGTQYLAQSLSKLLLHHIHESLPELRTKMSNLLLDAQKEMLSYGDPMLDESNNKVNCHFLTGNVNHAFYQSFYSLDLFNQF